MTTRDPTRTTTAEHGRTESTTNHAATATTGHVHTTVEETGSGPVRTASAHPPHDAPPGNARPHETTATAPSRAPAQGAANRPAGAGTAQYPADPTPAESRPAQDDAPGMTISTGEAKILPFVLALGGFFLVSGSNLRFGLLIGAVLTIVAVSGEFVVRLGREFLENVEKYV